MTVERWSPRIAGMLIAGVALSALADDVYKTVDAQGRVTYSDHAISPESKRVTVDVIQGNPQEAARLAKERAVVNAGAAEQAKQAQQQANEQLRQQAQAASQKQACEAARNRYGTFSAGGRIYHTDDQGNRAFYSDEEIEAQRISAKAAMDSACGQ
jgi:hypothetical protein